MQDFLLLKGGAMITDTQKQLLDTYNKALELYKERRWDDALQYFTKALEVSPEDGPSKLYIERCREYKLSPPPPDWDGVFVMKTK